MELLTEEQKEQALQGLNVTIDTIVDMVLDSMEYHTKDTLTLREAARYLGISVRTLHRIMKNGQVAFSRPFGNCTYFRKEDLEVFMGINRVEESEKWLKRRQRIYGLQ